MKTKAAKFFSCCKYELIVFAVLFVQAVMNLISYGGVGEYTSVYYLANYSMGMGSRLLIGSIVSLLNDSPTIEWIGGFAIVFLMLTLLAVALLTGKVLRNADAEMKPQIYVFVAFMISSSFTFSFFSKYLGMLDIYTFIVAMAAVVCVFSKKTRWLVPVLCVAGVMIHNIFVITYFPLIAITLFYFLMKEDSKAYSAVVFVVSLVVTAAFTIYFTVYASENMKITFEEFCKIIREKSSVEIGDGGLYGIGFHLFNIVGDDVVEGFTLGEKLDLSFNELMAGIMQYLRATVTLDGAIPVMIADALVLGAFWVVWIKCIKNSETKSGKLVYISYMLVPLITIIGFAIAVDYVRWVQAAFLTQFGFVLVMFMKKDEAFTKTMEQMREYFSNKKLLLAIIFVIYASTIQMNLS